MMLFLGRRILSGKINEEFLALHVVGHFGLHNLIGGAGVAGEDEALCEGCIEATMGGLGKPDEVFRTVVRSDTVEMVTIVGMQMPI